MNTGTQLNKDNANILSTYHFIKHKQGIKLIPEQLTSLAVLE